MITKAILNYVGESQTNDMSEMDMSKVQLLIAEMAKRKVEKAMCVGVQKQDKQPSVSVSLMDTNDPLNIGEEVTRAARNTLNAFRRLSED